MEFIVLSKKREEIIDITKEVRAAVKKLYVEYKKKICNKDIAACLVYVPHTTCAIIINENYDSDVHVDILEHLGKMVPVGIGKHAEGNSDAHIKSSLLGQNQVIPIENGELQLGRWQGIALAEFDGPRERKVIVKIL
jgi:secondary thiamine-phosphate synthase enzyme